jgi:uncharacterized protein
MIPVRRLAGGPLDWEATLPRGVPPLSGTGLSLAEDPTVRLVVERSPDGGVHAVGTLEAKYGLECRRCLSEMTQEILLPVDVWFEPAVEDDSGDEAVYAMAGDAASIDIAPAIRDELILALPEFPVCRSDCPGMCPGCGADLSEEACVCGPKEVDPRWEALREARDE